MKTVQILSFVCFFALFILIGCKEKPLQEEPKKTFALSDAMLKSTTTAVALEEPLRNELTFYGKITADNNKLIEIYPIVGGNVLRVDVELGDYVKKGQLLATIRSNEAAGYEKELIDSKNDVLIAKNNLKVSQELFEGKMVAERTVIEAESQLEKAISQLHRIEETYKIYSIKEGSLYEIRSPIDGFIIQKRINQDMLLRSDKTDNIFDIAQINDVWAIANVNESDINQVRLGVDAFVTTLSNHDRVFKGSVDKIFNVIDPETMAMKVRIKLKNPEYVLKPEMRANIRIAYAEDRKMLAIPSKAVIFDKSKHFVMIFKDRHNIETRQVEVFRQVGDVAFIASGLQKNEVVMTTNQLLVYDALND